MKKTFKQYLIETPIGDYTTFGDWTKNSSFRDQRDRTLIQHPKAIERTRKKFGNTDYEFNFYFVNSPKANKVTEEGLVNIEFVRSNLGDEVADAVAQNMDNDSINVIFTNNKGSERKNMSAWIMAHRIGHALARQNGRRGRHSGYMQASNHLISQFAQCMEYYGVGDFPTSEDKLGNRGWDNHDREKSRKNELSMLAFFYEVGGFRSARERNIRDWFEVLNELIAQHLTTGKIKFRPAPAQFGQKGPKGFNYYTKEQSEVDDILDMLGRDMGMYIDDMLGAVCNGVMVM